MQVSCKAAPSKPAPQPPSSPKRATPEPAFPGAFRADSAIARPPEFWTGASTGNVAATMDKPRIPITWSDWVSGDWLGPANPRTPLGKVAPVVAESIDTFARVVGATLGTAAELGGPAAPQFLIEQLLSTARARLVGRSLALKSGLATLHLTLDDLQFAASPLGFALGQFGTITADTSKVSWDGGRLDALTVKFKNVHLRPGTQPALIIAPIKFSAEIKQDVLNELIADAAEKVSVELQPNGVAIARRPGRETWGNAQIVPRIEGNNVRLVATGVTVGSRSFSTTRAGVPSALIEVPKLPGGMRMTDISIGDSCVRIEAIINEWREPISAQQLVMLSEMARTDSDQLDFSNAFGKAQ